MIADWKQRIAEKRKKLENSPDLQVNARSWRSETSTLKSRRQQRLQGETEKQIAAITDRINAVPGRRSRSRRVGPRIRNEEDRLRQAAR